MPNANIEITTKQIVDLLGCNKNSILSISAKEGVGISKVLSSIIERIPPPKIPGENGTRALIFDSIFDQFRGIVPYVQFSRPDFATLFRLMTHRPKIRGQLSPIHISL